MLQNVAKVANVAVVAKLVKLAKFRKCQDIVTTRNVQNETGKKSFYDQIQKFLKISSFPIIMAIRVVEFSNEGYKVRKIFA